MSSDASERRQRRFFVRRCGGTRDVLGKSRNEPSSAAAVVFVIALLLAAAAAEEPSPSPSADGRRETVFSARRLRLRGDDSASSVGAPSPASAAAAAPELLLKLARIRAARISNDLLLLAAAAEAATETKGDGRPSGGGVELVDVDFSRPPSPSPTAEERAAHQQFRLLERLRLGATTAAESVKVQQERKLVNADRPPSSVVDAGDGTRTRSGRRRNDKTLSFPIRVVLSNSDLNDKPPAPAKSNNRDVKAAKFPARAKQPAAPGVAGTRDKAGNEIPVGNPAPAGAGSSSPTAPRQFGTGTRGGSSTAFSTPGEQPYLPECASQQVCAAVHMRFNSSTPLCSCPLRFGERCSTSLSADDGHSMGLVTDPFASPLTLVKTCEPNRVIETCHNQKDWSLFALQNTRTRKAHYLIICSCPRGRFMEGPIEHAAPDYAQVPGIRIFGMMCVTAPMRKGKHTAPNSEKEGEVEHPTADLWSRISEFLQHLHVWS